MEEGILAMMMAETAASLWPSGQARQGLGCSSARVQVLDALDRGLQGAAAFISKDLLGPGCGLIGLEPCVARCQAA